MVAGELSDNLAVMYLAEVTLIGAPSRVTAVEGGGEASPGGGSQARLGLCLSLRTRPVPSPVRIFYNRVSLGERLSPLGAGQTAPFPLSSLLR